MQGQSQLRETLISMHAHVVVGPDVVVGGIHKHLADDTYTDEHGLAFMFSPVDRLRAEVLARRLMPV